MEDARDHLLATTGVVALSQQRRAATRPTAPRHPAPGLPRRDHTTPITLAENRIVVTREDPWPCGFITGYEADGGFVVEHIVSFRPDVLLPLLRDGIALATERGYGHLRLRLPREWILTPRLRLLALRMGFTRYHEDGAWIDYVKYI